MTTVHIKCTTIILIILNSLFFMRLYPNQGVVLQIPSLMLLILYSI